MYAVDYGDPPPDELVLGWQCERWHTLPEPGGMYDQDAGLVYRMGALMNIHRTVSRVRNLYGAQIHSMSDSERRMIRWLREQEMM